MRILIEIFSLEEFSAIMSIVRGDAPEKTEADVAKIQEVTARIRLSADRIGMSEEALKHIAEEKK